MAKQKKRKRTKSQPKPQIISAQTIIIVVAVALLGVSGLILLGGPSQPVSKPIDISQFPAIGVEDAPVTIIEYSDYG